jgi:hypothetical protein
VLSSVWIRVANMIEIVIMGRFSGAAAALPEVESEDIGGPGG